MPGVSWDVLRLCPLCFCQCLVLGILILWRLVTWTTIIRSALRCGLPCLVCRPGKGEDLDCAWRGHGREGVESLQHNLALQGRCVWFSCGVPQGVIEKRGPRRIDSPGNVESTGHTQGGNTGGFDLPCNQPDGLMTDWSHRDKQHGVHALVEEAGGQCRGEVFLDPPRRVDATHKGVGLGR